MLSILRFARTNATQTGGTANSQDINHIDDEMLNVKRDSHSMQVYGDKQEAKKRLVEQHIV